MRGTRNKTMCVSCFDYNISGFGTALFRAKMTMTCLPDVGYSTITIASVTVTVLVYSVYC